MENKTHVGFNKKGELTSGKCDASERVCPYGNHFADPNEAHNYLEHVSEVVNSLSPDLKEYIHERADGDGGFKKVPLEVAKEKGFPEEVAKLLAGEPTDPKYAREYVMSATGGEEVAPLIVKSEGEFQEDGGEAPKLNLDNPDDVRKMHEILSGYKVSEKKDFEAPPPYILEDIEREEDDELKDKFVEEYKRFGKTLTMMRLGLTDEISPEDAAHMAELTARVAIFRDTARKASSHKWLSNSADADDAQKLITDYGEGGHEVEDRLIQDGLAEMANGESYSNFLEASRAINGELIHQEVADEKGEALNWAKRQKHKMMMRELKQKYGSPPKKDTPDPNYDALIAAIQRKETRESPDEMKARIEASLGMAKHSRAVRYYSKLLEVASAKKEAALDKQAELERKYANLKGSEPAERPKGLSGFNPKWKPVETIGSKRIISDEYYQSAVKRTREKLKPGSFVMLNGQDAEVYRLDERGNLVAPNGGIWGRVDYDNGAIIGYDGHEVFTTSGARVYENEEELKKYAALDDSPHDEVAEHSADPGRVSRYEQDPKYKKPFKRVLNFFRRKERALRERAARNREKSLVASHPAPDAMYKLAVERFSMPPIAKFNDKLDERGKKTLYNYLSKRIDEGSIRSSSKKKTIVPAKRRDVDSYSPVGTTPYDLVDEPLSTEEKVALVHAARRQRDIITSQADKFGGAFEGRISNLNPSAHRRRNWTDKDMPLSEAEDGNLLYGKQKADGTRDVYVVVDRKEGKVSPIKHNLIPADRLDSNPRYVGINALVSDYAIDNAIHRYKADDLSLPVEIMSFDDGDDNLKLW